MRSTLRALAVGALLFTGTALHAAPAEAAAIRPPGSGEACTYSVSQDGYQATAVCKNDNNHPIEFRAVIICGLSWDSSGDRVTVQPGKRKSSSGRCSQLGTGVGGVSADVRDL